MRWTLRCSVFIIAFLIRKKVGYNERGAQGGEAGKRGRDEGEEGWAWEEWKRCCSFGRRRQAARVSLLIPSNTLELIITIHC